MTVTYPLMNHRNRTYRIVVLSGSAPVYFRMETNQKRIIGLYLNSLRTERISGQLILVKGKEGEFVRCGRPDGFMDYPDDAPFQLRISDSQSKFPSPAESASTP